MSGIKTFESARWYIPDVVEVANVIILEISFVRVSRFNPLKKNCAFRIINASEKLGALKNIQAMETVINVMRVFKHFGIGIFIFFKQSRIETPIP